MKTKEIRRNIEEESKIMRKQKIILKNIHKRIKTSNNH